MNRAQFDSSPLSWATLARLAYDSRRLALQVGLALAILAVLGRVILPKQWRSEAAFMPQARQAAGGIGGIAAQLGVDVPTADPAQSPHFYVELLRSSQFLRRASAAYPTSTGKPVALASLLDAEDGDTARARENVGEALLSHMTVLVAPRTGVVSVNLRLSDPVASRSVLMRLLDELDAFNVETRRSRAQAERKFTERRVVELRTELREAEDRLEEFLRRNRITQFSPELTFQRDRLAREISLRQQVYSTMVQAYEQAKIDEVRDTPVLTRITGPTLPSRPDGPGPFRAMAFGFLLGVVATLLARVAWPLMKTVRRAD